MFLKPFKLKSNAPLKGSDAKKLRQRIQRDYPDANLDLLIPSKSNVTVLKLITHSEFQTTAYCVDKLPMFFEDEENKLVPTLYSLWQVPDLLPYFTTQPAVLPRLSNGANLMLPGIVPLGTGRNIYGHYKKGQLVAVNLTSNKSAVGVGYLFRSSDDLYMTGGHGAGVVMLHLFGDKLWGHEPQLAQQVPQQLKLTKLTDDDFPALGVSLPKKPNEKKEYVEKQTDVNEEVTTKEELNNLANLAINNSEEQQANDTKNVGENEDHTALIVAESTEAESPEMLLKNAFLSALKNHGKSLQLPLLTSNFYRLYVVPEAQETIDLKKTKYKKLSNFLNEMIEQGFIVVKEETKGVDKITFIDFEHPELVNFITDFKKPKADADGTVETPLFHSELTELYTITAATAPLFTKLNYKRGEGIPASRVKKVIREYVNKVNLPLTKDPQAEEKSYMLDECLQQICGTNLAPLSRLINSVISQMEHSYQMCKVKDVAGNKPMIQMSLATRSGNKKVTLVSNIECYGIILTEFIKLCKQGAAASTTIVTLPNQNREMLQIQGNQVRFIHTLLTQTYKIPPKFILGLELAKDGKKHKKK